MERRVVAPVRVVLEGGLLAEHRPPATCVAGEDRDQPLRKLVGDLIQCQVVARAGRTFDREIIAVVMSACSAADSTSSGCACTMVAGH
jgi:hypothetical protein